MKPSASLSRRRFVHLWFDRLSTDRIQRARPDLSPLVLVDMHKGALRLTAIDLAAQADGLSLGLSLADARARTPQINVLRADPAADEALLGRLGEACRRYTPAFALHAPDGLDLDVTGCEPLFGGEDALMAGMSARLRGQGLSLRAALADTPAQAYACARFSGGGVVEPGAAEAILSPLPMAALRLKPSDCAVLDRLGLKRIGQLIALPRAAITRRFGEEVLHRLDEAMGHRAGPLELRLERPPFLAERRLFEPISEPAQVLEVVGDLARDLAVQLTGRAMGGRRFALDLFRVDGAVKRLDVASSHPLRDPGRMTALFTERLAGLNEGLQADFGFDQLRLIAGSTQAAIGGALDLLQTTDGQGALADLADRLVARSDARVRRLKPGDAHRPERAERAASLDSPVDWKAEPAPRFEDTPLRPLRLFRPPQPIDVAAAEIPDGPPGRFTWRRVTHTVVRAEGPERLEPQWALDPHDLDRDYYRLEDEAGRRFWVFRRGRYGMAGRIPLSAYGLPEPPTPAEPKAPPRMPQWFVHGVFG
jgi:protein ImuB